MRALEVMLHIVFRIIAPKKAWQQNILMIPIGGGPPIAPTFQHFKDISNSISLELLQGGVKGDRVGEVQCERLEQFGESFQWYQGYYTHAYW